MSKTSELRVKDVEDVLRGKQKTQEVEPPRRATVASRMAVSVSRRVTAQAQAEVIREVMAKFIATIYEVDGRGVFWNVSEFGRVEISVPWSRNGASKWAVRRIHAEILKHSMMRIQNGRSLFLFDEIDRRWYLNLKLFPTYESGMEWLESFNIDGDMWNVLVDAWKQSRGMPT